MSYSTGALIFATFFCLLIATLVTGSSRRALMGRSGEEWAVDLAGLVAQGILVPLAQATLVFMLCELLLPRARGVIELQPLTAFGLNFVAVDYLYYWNHRLLHSRALWAVHRLHHGATRVDVLMTARNTLVAPVFILYLWANGAMIYLLADPVPYAWAAALTAALDLWRHSSAGPKAGSVLDRALSGWFTLPRDHHWHHASGARGSNYSANFVAWDRLHGTWHKSTALPESYGESIQGGLLQRWVRP